MNVEILNVFHTHFYCRVDHPYYLPIQSGKALSHEDLDMQGDNEGENISERADMGEYRCVYWAWKNLPKDVDIIGLSHYRRFLDFHGLCNKYQEFSLYPIENFPQINFDIPKSFLKFVKMGGVITTRNTYYDTSVYDQFCHFHGSIYLSLFRETLNEMNENDFCRYFFKKIKTTNHFHPCCMFLMNRKQFDEYCLWIFPIFERYEEKMHAHNLINGLKDRSPVFIIERVWSVYIKYRKYRVKTLPFIHLCQTPAGSDCYNYSNILKIKTTIYRFRTKVMGFLYEKD